MINIIIGVFFILISPFAYSQRFDPNNINEKLFIAIRCVGITESIIKVGNESETTQEKYQKYLIIDKESKLVLNYHPKNSEQFTVSRGDWKITPKKITGFISNEERDTSLVLNFEYDTVENSFKETMILNNKTSYLSNKTEGLCYKLKSLPK